MKSSKQKRAEAAFISYILLTLLMVSLGTFVFSWLSGYVKSSGQDVKRVVYNYNNCESISISIDNACFDTGAQAISMNVTNRNNLRIDSLIMRAFDSEGNPDVIEQNTTLKPGKQKELIMPVNITDPTDLQIVPIMFKEDYIIICSDKKTASQLASC